MADWIKMRVNLDTDPRVIAIAAKLDLPELHIVGLLWKVWSWADQHSLDGNALIVTENTLDRFTGAPGFAAALRNVGWLEGRNGALTFPRFAEHNGQTAKSRAVTSKRVGKHRNGKGGEDVTVAPLPDKKREEKNTVPPLAPREPRAALCTIEQAVAQAPMCRMTERAARYWWHTRNKADWTTGSPGGAPARPITSWQSDMATSVEWAEREAAKLSQPAKTTSPDRCV